MDPVEQVLLACFSLVAWRLGVEILLGLLR